MALAVVDASVVIKWFLAEEDHEAARRLREDFLEGSLHLRVPSLLPYEVVSGLRFSRRFRASELTEAARGLDRAGLVTVPLFGEYLEHAIDLSIRHGVTIYDASYLALAALQDCPLYTSDEELLAKDSDDLRILHVREYGTGVGRAGG